MTTGAVVGRMRGVRCDHRGAAVANDAFCEGRSVANCGVALRAAEIPMVRDGVDARAATRSACGAVARAASSIPAGGKCRGLVAVNSECHDDGHRHDEEHDRAELKSLQLPTSSHSDDSITVGVTRRSSLRGHHTSRSHAGKWLVPSRHVLPDDIRAWTAAQRQGF